MAGRRGEQVGFEWAEQGGEKASGAAPAPTPAPARARVAGPRRKASRVPEPHPALPTDDELWDVHAAARFLKRSVSWVYQARSSLGMNLRPQPPSRRTGSVPSSAR
jgi:hypothetical protein